MRWLLKDFMKKDTYIYILGVILNVSGAFITRIFPVAAAGRIIDVGIIENNHNEMIKLFIFSITLFIIGRIMAYIGVLLIDSKAYNMNSRLSVSMHKKLYFLDHNYFENTTVGEINTLLSKDLRNIRHFIGYDIKQCTGEFLVAIASLIYCISINPVMALALIAFIPIFIYVTLNYSKKTEQMYKKEREKASNLNAYIQENIEGNRLIRNLGTEEKEIRKFKTLNGDYIDYKIRISYKMFNYIEVIKFLSYFMWGVMIFLGGIFIVKGDLTIGGFMIFNSYINRISAPMHNLVDYMSDFQYFKISIKKIKTFLSLNGKQKDNGTLKLKSVDTIKFNNVSFEIDNKRVLSNINLEIEKGKTYAFIGEVGCGKSSIGRLILRIIDYTDGNIYIDNVDINDYTIESVRDKIAYVSQTPFLFSDTIKNNVSFGNTNLKDEEVKYYLKLAKADYVKELEDGIETIIGENGVSLSGGEKQRLSLARALAKKPQLLILDDITSALDYESELEVTNNINNLDYDCTKIIIAQKIISVKNADKIFVLKSGQIIEEGTHEELLNKCNIYKEIYDIQSGRNLDELAI